METTGGTFKREVKVEEGFKLESDLVEKVQRHPDEDIFYIYDGVKGNAEKPAYGHINFQLGNAVRKIERIYPSILTLFQNVGGVGEILVFVFVYFMLMHHDVVLELYLLNYAVLGLGSGERPGKLKLKNNQVADAHTLASSRKQNGYTYFGIVMLKLMQFFCCRNSEQYLQYK